MIRVVAGDQSMVANRWRARALPLLLGFILSCGDDAPETAQFIQPDFGDPCQSWSCSGQGQCQPGSRESGPSCECATGYTGQHCDKCAKSFHRDFDDRCVPDRLCEEQPSDPCGVHGNCMDRDGVIACACHLGYEGARCNLCVPGYGLDEFGDCLQKVLKDGRLVSIPASCTAQSCHDHGLCKSLDQELDCECYVGYEGARCASCSPGYYSPEGIDRCIPSTKCDAPECGGCVVFDGAPRIPPNPNTCLSSRELQLEDLTSWSLGGEGTTWLCAPSRRYDLDTEHIALEAGAAAPAELKFREPVRKISFAYVPWDDLAVNVLADAKPVQTLTGKRYAKGRLEVEFDVPVQVVGLASDDGAVHTLAIDDLSYEFEPDACR
jgi:hypothetical protein